MKKYLLRIATKIQNGNQITPKEINDLIIFEDSKHDIFLVRMLKRLALPLSLILGFGFAAYGDYFDDLVKTFPNWTNMNQNILSGVDYLWGIFGNPIGKSNILFHLPNIILYSFGIFGIKKLFDALDRKTWLDTVLSAQAVLQNQITQGTTRLVMEKGHSLLFVGKGDFIGRQFTENHEPDQSVTISESKPSYTNIWNYYATDALYENLRTVLERADGMHAGEYIFFPVKDDQIFLPGSTSYDLSPHRLDILCQNIRKIEQQQKWKSKRIIIVGDKFHQSFVQSEDSKRVISGSKDIISLAAITQKYHNITLIDPTDIVLNEILILAKGRRIIFRATKEGIHEYKQRFYKRLTELGYSEKKAVKKRGVLTIGYDLFEDQTEQQSLVKKIDDYYPVVLSKSVHDALRRNGYKKSEFLYVPDLVLTKLNQTASEQ